MSFLVPTLGQGRSRLRAVRALLIAFALTQLAVPAVAHYPGKDLEVVMGKKEKFFQAVDKPAPALALRDADGREVTLSALKGKVIVLHFIYASCPDVCPLHADKIAEVQKLVNASPMRDSVRFIRRIALAAVHCTDGDVLIAASALVGSLLILGGGRWPYRGTRRWPRPPSSAGLPIFSEWLNTEVRGSWAYAGSMPQLPLIGTGLAPPAQWLTIPPLAFWWARRPLTAHAINANSTGDRGHA
jgi:SCO1/SenC family protein